MTEEEIKDLKLGDVVEHTPTGFSFVAFNTTGETPQVMTSVQIEHPEEWRLLKKDGEPSAEVVRQARR